MLGILYPKYWAFFIKYRGRGDRESERLYITQKSENGKMPRLDKDYLQC